jgi:hypothetical protein
MIRAFVNSKSGGARRDSSLIPRSKSAFGASAIAIKTDEPHCCRISRFD